MQYKHADGWSRKTWFSNRHDFRQSQVFKTKDFPIWPCDLSGLQWLLRLRYFRSERRFWKFEANDPIENKNHFPISFVARMAAGRKWIKNPVFMAQLNFYDLTVWLVEAAVAATVEIISIRKLFLKVWSKCSKWEKKSLLYFNRGKNGVHPKMGLESLYFQ